MILTGLTRDSGENVSDLFLSGAISAGRAATVFQDAEFDGATGVADLCCEWGQECPKRFGQKTHWKAVNGHLSMQLKSQCCTRKHIKCWKNLSSCCCHMKSWQISCPGTSTPNRRSLTGQGFQLQPESTFRKQCLCWEWIPPPASLLGCGQMGCPVKWGRSQSVIVITMSFCGQTDDIFSRLRIPLCVF